MFCTRNNIDLRRSILGYALCTAIMILSLSSCVEPLSWSPDGRYVVFWHESYLMLWDSEEDTVKTLLKLEDQELMGCHFLPNGEEVLYLKDDSRLFALSVETGKSRPVLDACAFAPVTSDVSSSGEHLYHVVEKPHVWELWQHRLVDPPFGRLLYTSEDEIAFPDVNQTDANLLLYKEVEDKHVLCSLDITDGRMTVLLENEDEVYAYPQWLDEHRFICHIGMDQKRGGALFLYDITSKERRDLASFRLFPCKPSLHPEGTSVVATAYKSENGDDTEIILIDFVTGKQAPLFPEASNTVAAYFSPCGEKIAYVETDAAWEASDAAYHFKTLNLSTGATKTFWSTSSEPSPLATFKEEAITGKTDESDREETIMLPGDVPLVLMRIPAGTFLMGRNPDEEGSSAAEDPQQEVTISQDFYLGKYPVTQRQWLAVMGAWPGTNPDDPHDMPSKQSGLGDDYPAYCISWDDAQDFIGAVNTHIANTGQESVTVRLPTEAEWEYACRAGTATRFYWGDDPGYTLISNYAWHDAPSGSKPVGQKLPNAFGLYDMSGNVWEWCQDWHGKRTSDPTTDPTGPSSGKYRILRGGYWGCEPSCCRSAAYCEAPPDERTGVFGFRIAGMQ